MHCAVQNHRGCRYRLSAVGSTLVVDLHINVNGKTSLNDVHKITDEVARRLEALPKGPGLCSFRTGQLGIKNRVAAAHAASASGPVRAVYFPSVHPNHKGLSQKLRQPLMVLKASNFIGPSGQSCRGWSSSADIPWLPGLRAMGRWS
jgi:hypothetical protein